MVRGRFAPSPSGRMHLGNLFCALLSWLSVKSRGGEWILRIEDLDTARCRPDYARQVEEDLRWLGLAWDEGGSTGGPDAPYFQSERTALYEAALERLREMGRVYPCFCTRAQRLAASAPHRSDGVVLYSGRCRHLTPAERETLSAQRAPAWRVQVPEETVSFRDQIQGDYAQNLAAECGDFILRRSDGVYAYQLAVVVDDAFQGVTQVVRGSDLLDSAPRQLWLQSKLGLPHPEYGHVPLLLSPDGRRLAKRDRDLELSQLKERFTAPQLVGRLALAAGLLPEYAPVTPQELLPHFAWDKLPRQDFVFEL